jgi:hypothetical protein
MSNPLVTPTFTVNVEDLQNVNVDVSEFNTRVVIGLGGVQGPPGQMGEDGAAGTGQFDASGLISTGNADLRYYPLSSNPSGYLTGFNSGLYVLRTETGQFYPSSNPQQYIRSGDVSSTYATIINLASTGQQTWNTANNNGTNLSGNLQSTGSVLDSRISSLSGYSNNTFATITNLAATGSNLQSQLNTLFSETGKYYPKTNPSGYISGFNSGIYINTGQTGQFYPASNPQQYIRSGDVSSVYATIVDLQSTGSVLDNRIGSLSGYSNLTFATITNLQATGSNLQTQINSINVGTGNFATVRVTGSNPILNPDFSGVGGTIIYTTGNRVLISGGGGSQDLSAYATITLVTGVSGHLSNRLGDTGSYLLGLISASSAGVSSINSSSGVITIAGAGSITVTTVGQSITVSGSTGFLTGYATVSNLQSTGANLFAALTGMSGQANTNYATIVNLASTGQQAWVAANSNGINLSGNLQTTGSTLDNRINSLSGYGNNTFATIVNLASTGQQSWVSANNNGINLSGNLQTTGSNLYLLMTGFSGQANSNFATITNLGFTGQQAWSAANNNGINLSGNLQSTGSILDGRINSLSGYSNNTFSQVKITGSNTVLVPNFTGLGGTTVSLTNGMVYVQSTTSAGGGGVTGVSVSAGDSITGLISLTSSAGIILSQQGNTINISPTGDRLPFIFATKNLSQGVANPFIEFPTHFSSVVVPIIVGNLINNSGDGLINYQFSGLVSSGFYLNLSSAPSTSFYSFNYFATTGLNYNELARTAATSTAGVGENNTASNLGGGVGIYDSKSNVDLRFNSISGRSGAFVSQSSNVIYIDHAPYSKSVTIEYPSTNDSITLFKTYNPVRVLRLDTIIRGFGLASGLFAIRSDPNRAVAGTELSNSYFSATGITFGDTYTSFSNPIISGNNWVWLDVLATGATLSGMTATIHYNNLQ